LTSNAVGGCVANPAAAADKSRCWWTCGGCTRSNDVTTCPQKYTWGLTYDDGPAYYTPDLLNYLKQVNLKATFFVVGSRVASFPGLLQQEYLAGHQIAVHTWSHPYLTTQSTEQIIAELGWTRKVIQDVLGVQPLYMRPPYGDIEYVYPVLAWYGVDDYLLLSDRVRAISMAMNMYPVMWTRINASATFDTDGKRSSF
jgi:peptidoglycan/xylan/chitin deacetylase (PgdA/CDA1 family)